MELVLVDVRIAFQKQLMKVWRPVAERVFSWVEYFDLIGVNDRAVGDDVKEC